MKVDRQLDPDVEAKLDRGLAGLVEREGESGPRHPVAFKLNHKQHESVTIDLSLVRDAAGIEITMSAYAKNALLNYGRLRHLEQELRGLLGDLRGARKLTGDDLHAYVNRIETMLAARA